ncbi:5-guanidino-2-oxopentanoate decarboxylase [Martelella radicis]|uniref:Acetolactate synthase-1/2/3 large subunit n=1 Tax=Martelella radicis TaxID=1397476 RepID=A0A7W6KK58_9HYPH|nr:5-guanidino-2-oxopentanoate decarboxylase [Martelella radicis]MBB4122505.1 acetolactate synthase-1/2/3 large subunit [Martelella radicis]
MSDAQTMTVGEALVRLLEIHGVEVVFGIPGVHTAELYRGLAASKIRHVTPRHEQGAGFMADGYARVTGKPGVAFVITGPGLTNTITAMAQARADSVPMLVISGVNARKTLGKGEGCLHELPDQQALMRSFAKESVTLMRGGELSGTLARCLALAICGRPGPVHLEIPTDVMIEKIVLPETTALSEALPDTDEDALERSAALVDAAKAPVILAGGGASGADQALRGFAERLDAPVVLTANARGLLAGHPLLVPASASLKPVRDLIAQSDLVIAVGTEFGQTDYDVYVDGGFPPLPRLVRIDLDSEGIALGPPADAAILADSAVALVRLSALFQARKNDGARRAKAVREEAWAGLSDKIRDEVSLLHRLRDRVPGGRFVGDSTQLVYAANLYLEAEEPKRWFNSATGYGALGYVPPGAIGAAIGDPSRPVIAIVGDGGLQFSLSELGTAADEKANIVFLVWNNRGYREIETYMEDAGIVPEGVKPTPPDMEKIAAAYGLGFSTTADEDALVAAVATAALSGGPHLVEFRTD